MDLKCPCCEKGFSGKTAQIRLNSHCKAYHFTYYRQHIRPLKDPKQVNHDVYVRQKQRDPVKVQKDRLMARMRKRARKEQIDRITRGFNIEPPPVPGDTTIDPTNPFYVIEFTLRIFIGLTYQELISFNVIPTLEEVLEGTCSWTRLASERSQYPADLKFQVGNALAVARSANQLHTLAHTYYKYRQAIHDAEFYEERLQHYENRLLVQEGKMLNPEHYVDRELVEKRAAELVAEYRPKNRSTVRDATRQQHDKPDSSPGEEDDGDNGDENDQEEPDWTDARLPEVIPDSDRERSPEL